MEANGLRQQVLQLEQAARDNRTSIARLGERMGKAETGQALTEERHREMTKDIAALTNTVTWLTRGAWAVAGTFLILAVTIALAVSGL